MSFNKKFLPLIIYFIFTFHIVFLSSKLLNVAEFSHLIPTLDELHQFHIINISVKRGQLEREKGKDQKLSECDARRTLMGG